MRIENPILNQIWKDRYQKNNETIEENLRRVAKYISSNETEEEEFYNIMDQGLFLPAGRTMSNSGIGRELTLNNCFNLNNVPDSIEGIFDYIKYGAITQKAGGGTGYNFSLIRPKDTPTSNDAIASGVVSFMEAFDSQTHTILQGGRRGANMSVLSIYHPDIFDYLEAKSYSEGKLVHFNLSVLIDDDFMIAKNNNEDIYLHYPCITKEGEPIKDSSKWKIKKKINAKYLWDIIMKKAYDTGEYGVFFYDTLNRDNTMYYMENITGTNPCFRGDMKILTTEGYTPIGELDSKTVNIINKDGNISEGKIWCSGEKEIYKIKLSNKKDIYCTKDHRFMLVDGSECEAKDLKGKHIMPYLSSTDTLKNTPVESCPYVVSVKTTNKIEKVYDFNEPLTHWGVIEGFVAHNCGEYVSGVLYGKNPQTKENINSDDFMGACNLGSIYLHNFVENPFTKESKFNYERLDTVISNAVRLLDNIIDINKFPMKQFENYQKNIRTIGLGITGLADMLTMLNLKYGSKEASKFTFNLTNYIAKQAYKSSIELAKEKGCFPFLDKVKFSNNNFIKKHIKIDKEWEVIQQDILKYGIRNGRILSVAPTGTLSLTFGNNCSSGLEPIFSLEYDRKVKIGGQDESDVKIVKMRDYAYNEWLKVKDSDTCIVKEDVFVTAMNLTVNEHLEMLKSISFNIDMSCSKTINIPTEYSFEDTKKVYDYCWNNGIKGCTIFRPNTIRQGILIDSNKEELDKQEGKVDPEDKILRGEWESLSDDIIYIPKKIYIGCGKIKLMIGWSEKLKRIQDLYVIRTGSGGCEKNLQGMAIAMSGMLRLGGNIFNIEKAFSGMGGCNSFVSNRSQGKKLSKGSSCGTAILNAIKDFMKNEAICNNKTTNHVDRSQVQKEPQKSNESHLNEVEKMFLNQHGEIAYALNFKKCPLCGELLEYNGGCLSCQSCGWSKCE